MATRAFTRPVVLLMGRGFLYPYLQRHPDSSAPPPGGAFADFGSPATFVPQKVRAKKRLAALAIMAATLLIAGAAAMLTR
jgi:hypothetical protein